MSNIHEIDGEGMEYKRKAASICNDTNLSKKEAEAYALIKHGDMTRQEAADKLDIKIGNLDGKLDRIRKKIDKARHTAKLEI